VDTVRAGDTAVVLRPGQMVTAVVGAQAVWAAPVVRGATTDSVLTLPYRYVATDVRAAVTLYLRPSIEIEPLRYSPQARLFTGVLFVGLEDSLAPAESYPLVRPVRLFLRADDATLEPQALAIDHTNLPLERVLISATAPGESVRVHVRPDINPAGVDAWIPVRHPPIAVEPVPRTVPGLGLGSGALLVTTPDEMGATPRSVRLTALRGSPQPDTLTLAGGATGRAAIRSVGIGRDTIVARSGPFRSPPVELRYTWPLLFFGAALAGGVVGGAIAGFGARRRGKEISRLAYLVSGLASGLLVAVAFAVGLNFTGLQITTHQGEAVVFVVAAIGSLIGLPGLARVVPALARALAGTTAEST
ncbi:MAG: hypothetical protein ACREMV_05445, partial [Gemmatimonadales bacterium]